MGGAYQWPSLEDVLDYRQKVFDLVMDVIEREPLKLPITQESPWVNRWYCAYVHECTYHLMRWCPTSNHVTIQTSTLASWLHPPNTSSLPSNATTQILCQSTLSKVVVNLLHNGVQLSSFALFDLLCFYGKCPFWMLPNFRHLCFCKEVFLLELFFRSNMVWN